MSTNPLNQDVGCSMDQSSVKILAEPRNEPASSSQDFLKKKKNAEGKFNIIYSSDIFNYPLFML